MSPTRRDLFKFAAAVGVTTTLPLDVPITRAASPIAPVHVVWKASLAIVQHDDEYLVNELSLTITPAGVSFVVADSAPLSERRTLESADPAVASFLSDVVAAMRAMQYKKRSLDKQFTDDQWRQFATKQLACERLSDMVLE